MLCDSNYLHFALALLMSIKNGNIADLFINFLCLDDKTYNVISNLEMYDNIKCYREDIMLISQDVNNLKNTTAEVKFSHPGCKLQLTAAFLTVTANLGILCQMA